MSEPKTKLQEARIVIASRCRGNHIEDLLRCETCDPILAALDAAVEEAQQEGDVWMIRAEAEKARADAAERKCDKFRAAEKELSDAYLDVRREVEAWGTKHGGVDRFDVTIACIRALKQSLAAMTRERDEARAAGHSEALHKVAKWLDPEKPETNTVWLLDRLEELDSQDAEEPPNV